MSSAGSTPPSLKSRTQDPGEFALVPAELVPLASDRLAMIGHSQPLLSEPVSVDKPSRRAPWCYGVAVLAVSSVAAAACYYVLHQPHPTFPSPSPTSTHEKGSDLLSCGTKEECLAIVDNYFLGAKRQTFHKSGAGLVQTYGPHSLGGGPCGDNGCKLVEPCPNYAVTPHCRFDVYDNALAAIYLTKRGMTSEARKVNHASMGGVRVRAGRAGRARRVARWRWHLPTSAPRLHRTRQVLDAFITLLYPTGNVTPGLDYGAPGGTLLPSRRSLTLLAAGYTDKPAYAGVYQGVGVADGAVDTGNNAWVRIALALPLTLPLTLPLRLSLTLPLRLPLTLPLRLSLTLSLSLRLSLSRWAWRSRTTRPRRATVRRRQQPQP